MDTVDNQPAEYTEDEIREFADQYSRSAGRAIAEALVLGVGTPQQIASAHAIWNLCGKMEVIRNGDASADTVVE